LIEHARDPEGLMRAANVQSQHVESVFEELVLQRLLAAGYRVKTQWPVGAYRIDLVVEGAKDKLAVECDGEKWHTPEQLQRDIERQSVLERTGNGWKFVRIRGSVFFRDPDAAMAPVFVKLDQLGIEPLGQSVEALYSGGIVERIKRRAEAFRARSQKESDDAPNAPEKRPHREDAIHTDGTPTQASPQRALPKSTIAQPVQKQNRLLDELAKVDSSVGDRSCGQCGRILLLAITTEGVVLTCTECKKAQRVDADILQRLADRLMASCFSCTSGKLKSTAKPYGNILLCQNPDCGRNNSWQGISDRISRLPQSR
jgi:very-short-patch-repair endonuclease